MRILLAVDGSPSADRARDLVAAMPVNAGGSVRIVSVAPTLADLVGPSWGIAATADLGEIEADAVALHRDALEATMTELRCARSDLEIEAVLRRGRPASIIVEEARLMSADLVVVGHRGHGTWESLLLGSVSAEIVDRAPCPVLVARGERLGPVILADDGSTYARAAEAALLHWPIFGGLPIRIVTVIEQRFPYAVAIESLDYALAIEASAGESRATLAAATTEADAAAGRLREAGLDARSEVRTGDPAHQIIAAALAEEAGLIVVGTRGQTGLRRLILGSVARKVLLHAPCSVLVVRGGTRKPLTTARTDEKELVSSFG
jgi:nucleotide-binding universal stress UspA family protein